MRQRFGRTQACVAGVYFLNGAVFTSWYARLPAIRRGSRRRRSAPLPHLAASAAAGAAIAVVLARGLLPDHGAADAPRFVRPTRRLAAVGVVAFCGLLAEGAVFDWSGIYLATEAGADAGVAPLGLAAFALCMGLGRLAGDQVAARAGASATARGGALLAAAGLGLALASATPAIAVTGFAVMGLGLSAVFPLTLRASGTHEDVPGPALAAVSTIGYAGFLTGPPVIGLLADATGGLRLALTLVCALCVVAALVATYVDERHPGRSVA